jgi:hypothetical protein
MKYEKEPWPVPSARKRDQELTYRLHRPVACGDGAAHLPRDWISRRILLATMGSRRGRKGRPE